MKKYVFIGDIHGHHDIHKLNRTNFPEGKELSHDDALFMCGDFALVWEENSKQDTHWINWLGEIFPNTKILVTPGNHENYDLLEKLPRVELYGDTVGKLNEQIYILERGCVYTIDGIKILSLGGGTSWDKDDRKKRQRLMNRKIWWEQEAWCEKDFERCVHNLEKHDWKVDYVVSHVPPSNLLPRYSRLFGEEVGIKCEPDEMTDFFYNIMELGLSFKKWFHGHMHIDFVTGKHHALFEKPYIEIIS